MRILLALLLVAPAVAAQTSPAPGSLAAYQSARLYIEGVETVTSNQYGQVLNTTRTWQPLQGDRRISEELFYETVGRDDLVESVRQRRRTQTLAIGMGTVAVIAGGAFAWSGGGDPADGDDKGDIPVIVGGITVGTVGLGVALWGSNLSAKRETHVQAAAEMAAVYNAQLDAVEAAEPDSVIDARP